jgi:hypothetical protein
MMYELVVDGDFRLAAWNPQLTSGPDYSFPDVLWVEGTMLLSGQPVVVREGVTLLADGRQIWQKKVPVGARERRERKCCRD